MGYIKAEEILPIEIIELIQRYVDGTNIYIPRKQENRQKWGTKTSYKCELQNRNQMIYKDYLAGEPVCELAKNYYLSPKSIQRIIRQKKEECELA
ncbi:MAG: hypothetical protein HDR16_05100 [Lachnospiraceae bacterium]|nr:hypothetical protein [Lachnospiraceae bacterium]